MSVPYAAIVVLCLVSGITAAAPAGGSEEIHPGLWQLVGTRKIAGGEDEDPAVTDFAKRFPVRTCIIAGTVVDQEPQMLQTMLQNRSPFNAIRSVADGRRSGLEFVISADPRWSVRGPWFSRSFDRGWSWSTRSVMVMTGRDRHEVETWSYQQSMRSGVPQGVPEFEHRVEMWERQGPCPPGTPAGSLIDIEEFLKALRDTLRSRADPPAPPAVPTPPP